MAGQKIVSYCFTGAAGFSVSVAGVLSETELEAVMASTGLG